MKKIGLFGGTFNPIHFGHLRAAEEVGEFFGLDPLIFIPSADPPHKRKVRILPAPLRTEMVRLAISDNPRFSLSEIEAKRPGKSYSIETIEYFRRQFDQTPLYFIVGRDAFLEINTWKEYPSLFSLCHFVIMTRPGFGKKFTPEHLPVELAGNFCYDASRGVYIHSSGFMIIPKEITALDISATRIRENLQKGRSVKYLLPEVVEEFIHRNSLYRKEDAEAEG